MKHHDLDKLMRVELAPYDERAADAALDALIDLWLSAERNREQEAAAREGDEEDADDSLTHAEGVVE